MKSKDAVGRRTLLLGAPFVAGAASITPQIDTAAYPLALPSMPLHDPWIVADTATRTYFLFTRNEPRMTGDPRLGTMVYTSRDLRRWAKPRLIFALPQDAWANGGAWAPEVHFWKGRWYLLTTFHNEGARLDAQGADRSYRRSTLAAVADRIDGPYSLMRNGEPIAPQVLMTLDGTLYVDRRGRPWMVYAHEWLQVSDGTIEAIPLNDDLSAAGAPRLLFRASEATWALEASKRKSEKTIVTDGPELFRTRTGVLLMLWSSYDADGYVQSIARSRSGEIEGPWEQLEPLVRRDSGHGMLFKDFDDRLLMVLHRPFKFATGKLYEMRDAGDRLEIVRELTELDGEAYPTHP